MHVRKLLMVAALAFFTMLPASAFAQSWYLVPYFGLNFGGNANFGDFPNSDDALEHQMTFGATLGWVPKVVGLEFDLGFSPNAFEDTAGDRNFEFGTNNLTTLMANVVVGSAPGAGFRPYASAGVGLIRTHIESAGGLFNRLETNDFGFNVGGGISGQFTDNVGLRGDIRYFRSLQETERSGPLDLGLADFSFWRGTVGVIFRF